MNRCQWVDSAKLRTLAAEYVAVGTGEQKPPAFIARQFPRALNFASATIVAGLLWGFLLGVQGGRLHCDGAYGQETQSRGFRTRFISYED